MEEQIIKFLGKVYALSAVLVVGILIFFVGQMAYQQKYLDKQNINQITVSGQGKIYAKPDVALVSLGVKITGATVADVTKRSTDAMNATIDALKALKVDEKDIKTTSYNLYPNYNYTQDRGQIFEGYVLEQNIQIKIRDFTKIGDILSQATRPNNGHPGANLVGDLQFTIDDPEQFRQQARAEAIQKAKANAKNLARESGIDLGKIINIYENSYGYPMAYDSVSSIKGMGGATPEMASAPAIQPGQQEINVTINLTYQVK